MHAFITSHRHLQQQCRGGGGGGRSSSSSSSRSSGTTTTSKMGSVHHFEKIACGGILDHHGTKGHGYTPVKK